MPVLTNSQHEASALELASGTKPARAYVVAGFSPMGARQNAHRLLCNTDVSARALELRIEISTAVQAAVVDREIAQREKRLDELQERWDWLRDSLDWIKQERAAEFQDVAAGGGTGLIAKDIKGPNDTPVYIVDGGILRLVELLMAHEQRAAQETGQWEQKHRVVHEIEVRPDLSRLSHEELALLTALMDKATPLPVPALPAPATVDLK